MGAEMSDSANGQGWVSLPAGQRQVVVPVVGSVTLNSDIDLW